MVLIVLSGAVGINSSAVRPAAKSPPSRRRNILSGTVFVHAGGQTASAPYSRGIYSHGFFHSQGLFVFVCDVRVRRHRAHQAAVHVAHHRRRIFALTMPLFGGQQGRAGRAETARAAGHQRRHSAPSASSASPAAGPQFGNESKRAAWAAAGPSGRSPSRHFGPDGTAQTPLPARRQFGRPSGTRHRLPAARQTPSPPSGAAQSSPPADTPPLPPPSAG